MPDETEKRGPGQPRKICDEAIEIAYRYIGTEYTTDTRRRLRKWYEDQGITISNRTLGTIIAHARARQVADLDVPKDALTGEIVKFYQDIAFRPDAAAVVKIKAMDAIRDILGVGHQYGGMKNVSDSELYTADPALAAPRLQAGAMPSTGIGRPVQDSPGGAEKRQDGDSQAPPGAEPDLGKAKTEGMD